MHAIESPQSPALTPQTVKPRHSRAGFSLVEVTLAIGIVAFAFVALFGLVPIGLTNFRAAVDASTDATILQDMNSMVQVTEWKKLDSLEVTSGGDVFYFDEEGRRTDTQKKPSTQSSVVQRRLYQVKLLVENCYRPSTGPSGATTEIVDAHRIIVIIGDVSKPASRQDFDQITKAEDLETFMKKGNLRSRAFIVTRMESAKD